MNADPIGGKERRGFNGLTAKEWTSMSKNVWRDLSSPRTEKKLEHGATFPGALASILIKIYSKQGDLILDPFVGTGTTLESCRNLGRDGIGFEINDKYADYAKDTQRQQTLVPWGRVKVIHDDCRNVLNHVEKDSIQFVLTSPPYADFILRTEEDRKKTHKNTILVTENNSRAKRYSDGDPRDFGNLPYGTFLEEIGKLMKSLYSVTAPGGYHAWIVKDGRDTKRGIPYLPLHSDIANAGKDAGFQFHDLIVWDLNDGRSLVLNGFPSIFYTNQNCSFIVVLRKK